MGIFLESMIRKTEKAVKRAEIAVVRVTLLERALGESETKKKEIDRKLQLVTKHKKELEHLLIATNLVWLIIVIAIFNIM